MKKILTLCLLAAILLVASDCGKRPEAVSDVSDSTDRVAASDTSSNKIKILQFEGYEVTLTPQEDVGEIVNVKDLKNNRSFVVKEPGAWFFAVIGHNLILDVGTGASIRNVNVINLERNEKVFESEYYSTFVVEGDTVRYRKKITIDDESKKPKCPEEGNGFVEEHILDLTTLQDKKTGLVECVYFE